MRWGSMVCYASPTATRRNRYALMAAGWRFLTSTANPELHIKGWPFALDNGAWSAFAAGTAWDEERFLDCLTRVGGEADWVACPDVVADAAATLRLAASWVPRLLPVCRRVLLVVQDGMTPDDARAFVGAGCGIAIGGSDQWKEEQLGRRVWRRVAHGRWLHALRVNTRRRLRLAAAAGCDSYDGSGPTRFETHLHRMQRWTGEAACQASLF